MIALAETYLKGHWGLWTEGYKSGTNCEAGGSVGEGFAVLIMAWIVTVHVSPLAMLLHRF